MRSIRASPAGDLKSKFEEAINARRQEMEYVLGFIPKSRVGTILGVLAFLVMLFFTYRRKVKGAKQKRAEKR